MPHPRLFEVLKKGYTLKTFGADLSAGLIVGVVAIPLAVAFAIASGVTPDKGLLTAVVAGFLISALGGSNVQIGGPTGAFIVIVYGIVSRHGLEGLILATLMAGVILLVLGLARLGTVIQYIPYPVIVGFTSGIAVIIFSSQVNDLLGLGLTHVPGDFLDKWGTFLSHLGQINPWAIGISLGTVGAVVGLARLDRRIPGALLALVAATALTQFFQLPVETIGKRFGSISGSFPLPTLPPWSYDKVKELLLPAVSIAMLAGIESLLSAVVADGLTGKKHDPNQELVGQGVANIASALFGGIPATGAVARTATNVKSGAQTPVAGLIHSLVLLLVLLLLAPLAALIPLAALAGILATVSYNMSEQHTFRMLLKGPRGDVGVLLATFGLTVLIDLTVAIPIGILFALLAFLRKMSRAAQVTVHTDEWRDHSSELDPFGLTKMALPRGVEVFEVEGPLFFGAAERFKEAMLVVEKLPPVRILSLPHVPSIDASGIVILNDLLAQARAKGTHLLLAALRPTIRAALDKIGFTDRLGAENILAGLPAALDRAKTLLGVHEGSAADQLRAGGFAQIDASTPAEAIRRASDHFPLPEPLVRRLTQSMLEREALAPTALGTGLAFPHPRNPLAGQRAPLLFVAYLKTPVDWGAPDGKPVTTVFFLAATSLEGHLRALSALTKAGKRREFQVLLDGHASTEVLADWIDDHIDG
jgi:SulP family sulfate permease